MKKLKDSSAELRDFQPSIGMFNMFKGMGIIGVVIFHTTSSFSLVQPSGNINVFTKLLMVLFVICASALMPAFFVASGYGFRPQNIKGIKNKVTKILFPYSIMAIVTVILHFLLHYGMFHNLMGTVRESIKVMVGFILGLSSNMEIAGTIFYSCGIGWYLISLIGVIILLNEIIQFAKNKTWIVVLICTMAGVLLGKYKIFLFCIPQILIGVFFFYEGYLIKKHKVLYRKWKWSWSLLFAICTGILVMGGLYCGKLDNVADGVWNFSLLSVVVDGILAFLCLYIILIFNRFNNPIFSLLKNIGSKSLFIFCIHFHRMNAKNKQ